MPASGDLLAGRYRIPAPLGAGGMATVYRANDERLSREVAIKVLLPNLASDPVVAEPVRAAKARTLAAAAHPGVVSVFDVDAGDPKSVAASRSSSWSSVLGLVGGSIGVKASG